MRCALILSAVALILGAVAVVGRASAEDPPPSSPRPAPVAPAPKADLPRQKIDLGNGVSFEMVLLPAGEFDMGSPATEEGRLGDEVLHRVRITQPFWFARTELTQATWALVMGGNRSALKGSTLPVTDVSWNDCQSFVGRLNEAVAGGGFRLPTEAEWEYACRAGSRTRFCFGDEERTVAGYAWYDADSGSALQPVGTLKPNAWGLHDMHGNVWEWCQDWHRPYDVGQGVAVDPVGSDETSEGRVQRGGCWLDSAARVRSACRSFNVPAFYYAIIGLRIARTVVADVPPPQAPGNAPPAQSPAPAALGPSEPVPPAPSAPQASKPPAEPTKSGAFPTKDGEVPSWAKVAVEQVEAAKKAGVPVAFENSIKMRFVLIPAGTFTMGSPATEARRSDSETQHQVTLTTPYYLGITEVTNGQYRRFRADHDSGAGPYEGLSFNGDEQPVVNVSWDDATAFVGWLNTQERGRTYRLPTEAEWERACRAGTTTPFSWGTAIGTDQANYDGESTYGGGPKGVYRQTTVPVGTLPASPWGLFEIHGNAWEWCADWYEDFAPWNVTDPVGPPDGLGRVLRGGSWYGVPWNLRSASRDGNAHYGHGVYYGFRVAVSVTRR